MFPTNCIAINISFYFCITFELWTALRGTHVNRVPKIQKSAVIIIYNRGYLTHNKPIFKTLKLLKIDDLYKLTLLKFYYNLSYNLLPSYFNCYLKVTNDDLPCQYALRQSTSTNTTTNDTTCFYRVEYLTSIDTVIKLYTHTISRNNRKS